MLKNPTFIQLPLKNSFVSSLLCIMTFILSLNADPGEKKGGYFRAVTASSLSSLCKCWGQPRLTPGRQFSQRLNVINGCQLRRLEGRLQKGEKKNKPSPPQKKRLQPEGSVAQDFFFFPSTAKTHAKNEVFNVTFKVFTWDANIQESVNTSDIVIISSFSSKAPFAIFDQVCGHLKTSPVNFTHKLTLEIQPTSCLT